MRRLTVPPRPDWERVVESQGFHFHTPDGQPYWNEGACYSFTPAEVELFEEATAALDRMCLGAAEHVFSRRLFDAFGIPPAYRRFLTESWERDEHTVYGRFDLAYAPGGPPKLLEYNADTPTALLEAAVVQWFWFEDTRHGSDQFCGIHERLVEAWRAFAPGLSEPVYFASLRGHVEDFDTVQYLRDTAAQAGLRTEHLAVEEIRWHAGRGQFVDGAERDIRTIFKLYPWEWMFAEEFGPHLPASNTRWFEPPWKVILSNKAILAVLWELFPDSPYLLRAEFRPFGSSYVRKPRQGREGANVRIVERGQAVVSTGGAYSGEPIYQALFPLPRFDGHHAVIGSWMVNGHACGIGVREDRSAVTGNASRFVPHVIE